jgi:hypothetical protein
VLGHLDRCRADLGRSHVPLPPALEPLKVSVRCERRAAPRTRDETVGAEPSLRPLPYVARAVVGATRIEQRVHLLEENALGPCTDERVLLSASPGRQRDQGGESTTD